ncbi:phage major capsid protein [Corynebacterium pyruviciproducens]|uniref:Phage major capsid protein n=1 Tax=Corynebacterium pyruviciproducens TaxID=598660 RepID=A0AAF0YT88_9CORY|nr:phage major capsid protein [Corynebacterium pyruviciproducens]WOT02879.1 phage major capsid protein [Corynebacterium pyruviciproducens]
MSYEGVMVTPGMPQSLSNDGVAFHAADLLTGSLIDTCTTMFKSDMLSDRSVIQVPFIPELEDNLTFADEGAEIPETKTNAAQLEIPTRKLAALKVLSNEAASYDTHNAEYNGGSQSVRSMITANVIDSIVAKANAVLFGKQTVKSNAHTTSDPLVGLSQLEGTTDLGKLDKNLDPFIDGVSNILAHRGSQKQMVCVAHPYGWAKVSKMRDKLATERPIEPQELIKETDVTSEIIADGDVCKANEAVAQTFIAGMPMFISPDLPSDTILVFDTNNVIVAASPIRINMDNSYAFSRDAMSIRYTYRLGWRVFHPERIGKITVAGAPQGGAPA